MRKPVRRWARRRNLFAAIVRRLGHPIMPSARLYRRRPKHKGPRHLDEGRSLCGAGTRAPGPRYS